MLTWCLQKYRVPLRWSIIADDGKCRDHQSKYLPAEGTTLGLQGITWVEQTYIDVLRNEIEAFRKIFIDWVAAMDKETDLPDEWHLFNDPANFPEDDEPFNPDSF